MYLQTNCFLLCYSINNRTSYGNIFSKWYPEIKHYMPQTPIILVGNIIVNHNLKPCWRLLIFC